MDELGAWFDTTSLSAGAALVGRLAQTRPLPEIDLRPSGLRVRPPTDQGLTSDPAALQELRIVFDAVDTAAVKDFWGTAFGYRATGDERLVDPLHRGPDLLVLPTDDVRPLRNRFHIDVVRPSAVVETVRGDREPTGAWGVMLPDPEGNELDLVPGDALEAADWQTLFAAMTFYPATSAAQAVQLVTTVAHLADAAGIPLAVDIRADGVVIDHGKDQWEVVGEAFVDLARRIQDAAHDLGLTANTDALRFVQLGLDAVDVPAVQAFWTTVLGYVADPRVEVGEIYDPRRLNPGFIFQQLDASETERRQQRNRIRLELAITHDQLPARVDQAIAAGGQVRAEAPGRCSLTDPEGNELDLVARKPL